MKRIPFYDKADLTERFNASTARSQELKRFGAAAKHRRTARLRLENWKPLTAYHLAAVDVQSEVAEGTRIAS